MPEALDLVRRELGPDASVLHTRTLRGGLLRWLAVGREIEVTASNTVEVPSRLPAELAGELQLADVASAESLVPQAHEQDFGAQFRRNLKRTTPELDSMIEDLCRENDRAAAYHLPEPLYCLMRELLDAEVPEEIARELVTRPGILLPADDYQDPLLFKARAARLLEDEIEINGPIRVTPGRRRLVALVGPTGVGKTTTIAKLAANFRLREKRSVGLITVDTYRIAAVDQLRTYADIIDLPMEVVSTPKQMRKAVERFTNLDLVLLDTAGRSPRDDVRIQELKSLLAEAQPDEIHLVLSAAAGSHGLASVAERFAAVGAAALVLTKLDEAAALGNLLPLLRSCRLPLSYVTNGQNVPDDIVPADRQRVARLLLGVETGNA